LAIKALMVDVNGVLVDGRLEDGRPWHTSIEGDFGFSSATLHELFFAPYWDDIVIGRAELMQHLMTALRKIARIRLSLSPIGSQGIRVSSHLCCRNCR
jgi:putative hydrolase of the HAD superfamily